MFLRARKATREGCFSSVQLSSVGLKPLAQNAGVVCLNLWNRLVDWLPRLSVLQQQAPLVGQGPFRSMRRGRVRVFLSTLLFMEKTSSGHSRHMYPVMDMIEAARPGSCAC